MRISNHVESGRYRVVGNSRAANPVLRHASPVLGVSGRFNKPASIGKASAFTMIEIAICLAIIGFALVAIIGVLPYGMNTQRDNREETVINQDATVLLEAIRSGTHGADDLTNYVYAVVNTGAPQVGYFNPTLAGQMNFTPAVAYPSLNWKSTLTSGTNIVGLMSTPEYVNGFSNHIIAYVRSISGLAAEKPPQDNNIMVGDTFSYRVYCVNAAVAYDTNSLPLAGFNRQLSGVVGNVNKLGNMHELRMTFLWPQLPNGNVGNGHQTFRVSVAGQLSYQPTNNMDLYFYQPQSFIQQ